MSPRLTLSVTIERWPKLRKNSLSIRQYRLTVFASLVLWSVFLFSSAAVLAAGGTHDRLLRSPDKLSYPPLRFSPPKAERIVLHNGLIVYILEDHELPLVHLSLVVRTGSVLDPKGKEGLAEIAAKVMRTGGAGKMSGREIDDALEFMAGSIEPSASPESTQWTLNVLKKDIGKGMNIFSQILQVPRFDERKLKLAKELKLEEIRRIYDDPQKLAFREFNRLLYRDDHRGRLSSAASVKDLSLEDLRKFHDAYYFPKNMMIAISGDITVQEATRLIQENLGSWSGQKAAVSIPKPASAPSGHMRYIVKESPQSVVVMGQFAPSKKSAAYYAFEILDFLVGSGGFSSRIFQEVRTNRGLAYSAGSFYRARADYGVFGAYAIIKTESTPEVITLIQSILKRAQTTPPTPKETAWAKKSTVNSFIFEYQSAAQIASHQMMNEYNSLPDDFLSTYCTRIDTLTGKDLLNAGKDFLRPNDMSILILGSENGYNALKKVFPDLEKKRTEHD